VSGAKNIKPAKKIKILKCKIVSKAVRKSFVFFTRYRRIRISKNFKISFLLLSKRQTIAIRKGEKVTYVTVQGYVVLNCRSSDYQEKVVIPLDR
jgi:hypothetical protein